MKNAFYRAVAHGEGINVVPATDTMSDSNYEEVAPTAIGGDSVTDLPPRYYLSLPFIASYASFGLGFGSSWLGFVLPANVLYTAINLDLGPSANVIWVSLAFTLCQTIMFPIVGRLSDIFGRRWFWISGNVLAMVGFLICGWASDMSMLIGGSVLSGLGTGIQNLGPISAVPELVPFNHRYAAVGCSFAMLGPVQVLAPAIAQSFVAHTEQRWRWCYYLPAIISAICALFQFLFYFPPAFKDLHTRRTVRQVLEKFDYLGLALFIISAACLLLGISLGGQKYPWKSGQVIGTIVGGGVGFILLLIYGMLTLYLETAGGPTSNAHLEQKFAGDEPLIPMYLFRNRGFVALAACSSAGSMVFYSLSILWPSQISALFTQSATRIGWLSCSLTAGSVAGQVWVAMFGNRMRHAKEQIIFCSVVFTSLVGGMAAVNENKEAMAIVFSFLTVFAVGWMEVLALSGGPMMVHEGDVGISSALEMCIRNYFSSIATSICITVYTNKLTSNLPSYVTKAALSSGLPQSSLPSLFTAISGTDPLALQSVPGMTPSILAAVLSGKTIAYVKSFEVIYLASIAYGGIMIIAALSCPSFDDKLTSKVARKLQNVGPHTEKSSVTEKSPPCQQHVEEVA